MDITRGSCLCGSVTFQFTGQPRVFQYCHCSRCQKVTGSAHGAFLFVKPDQFQWQTGSEQVQRYELPEAEFYASCFCRECGSSLPWELQGGGSIAIPAGSLDDDPGMRPQRNIFHDSRACWYKPGSELQSFAERPVTTK